MMTGPRPLSAGKTIKSLFSGRVLSSFLGPVGMLCFRGSPRRFSVTALEISFWKSARAFSMAGFALGGVKPLGLYNLLQKEPLSRTPSLDQKYLRRMSRFNLWQVSLTLGLGIGFSTQNFKPFHSSCPVSSGGFLEVHKPWYAVWCDLYKL